MNKQVAISHPEFGEGLCMESALEVWLAKGWTREDADEPQVKPAPEQAKPTSDKPASAMHLNVADSRVTTQN